MSRVVPVCVFVCSCNRETIIIWKFYRLGVPEQALDGIPLGFEIVVEGY